MHVSMRGVDVILEMVSRNAFSLWVLLSTGCPWIEKVVDALESATSLPGDFSASLVG